MTSPKTSPLKEFSTLADFIHSLGERGRTGEALELNSRTLNKRMKFPATFTLGELQRLANYGHTDLLTVVQLADKQIKNPIEPPVAALGRPVQQH